MKEKCRNLTGIMLFLILLLIVSTTILAAESKVTSNNYIGWATGNFVPEDAVRGVPTAQIQDTALVDLINKVQLEYTGADISAAAPLTCDSNIKKGDIRLKDIARIYKWEDTLYMVEINGKELKDYMEWAASYYNTYKPGDITISFTPGIKGSNFDIFSGVDYKIDISKPVGERIVDLSYLGQAVRDDQEFLLAVNNHRYFGLKTDGIIHNEPVFKSEISSREMLIEYIKKNKVIKPEVDNNWGIIGADLNHWAKDEAVKLINEGILKIPADKRSNCASLNLNLVLTRGKYAEILVRLFNFDLPARVEEPTFTDVGEDLVPYVEAVHKAGISGRLPGGPFGPDKRVTREMAVNMLVNAMKIKYYPEPAVLDKFIDNKSISSWARFNLAKAFELGLIKGFADNTIRPKKIMTLGEMAVLLTNYLEKFKPIDILSTNDFHGSVEAGYEAGAARLAAVIEHYRSANPEGTILLDAGDSYQGTPISTLNQGAPVIELFNYLDYTAQAVGNNEFDWGIDTLKEITEQADYTFLAANIYNKESGQMVEWAEPYLMTEVQGIKLGIIGISTPDTLNTTIPSIIAGLEFKDPAKAINHYTDELRAFGADLVVVLSHMPGYIDCETGKLSGELIDVVKEVYVDGVIGGHSHTTVTGMINGIPFVEAYKNGRRIGHLRYYLSTETGSIYRGGVTTHAVRKTIMAIQPDVDVQMMIEKYQKELESIMAEVLTDARAELRRDYSDVSSLGNLITDVMRETANVEIAFQNASGIRINIPAGQIKLGHLYRLLPFGNTIVVGEMTGKQIMDILEQSFTLDKGMLQLSGLKVKYDVSKPEYSRVVDIKLADGSPLNMEQTYRVAVNNFLAEGGDNFTTFSEVEFRETYQKVRETVIDYLRSQDEIEPGVDDRIVEVNAEDENQASSIVSID